jgi:catechol 2,3-dioxygenase-like lactoylglutathione lyase family enzyme
MASITNPHHTGFHVADLERSLHFYRDLLGFEVVFQWNPQAPYIREVVGYPDVDLHVAVLRMPNSEVFLELLEYRNVERTPVDTRTANPGTAHVAFFVENLDELYADLVDRGVDSVSRPVTPAMGPNQGGRIVYMIDPDGFRVEFIESAGSFGEFSTD